MFKELIMAAIPFLKPLVVRLLEKLIDFLVLEAEDRFSDKIKAGKAKKDYVMNEVYDYLNKNNGSKTKALKDYMGDKVEIGIDKLVEKAVKKLK